MPQTIEYEISDRLVFFIAMLRDSPDGSTLEVDTGSEAFARLIAGLELPSVVKPTGVLAKLGLAAKPILLTSSTRVRLIQNALDIFSEIAKASLGALLRTPDGATIEAPHLFDYDAGSGSGWYAFCAAESESALDFFRPGASAVRRVSS